MAVKDKLISNEVLKAVNDNMQGQVTDLKSAIGADMVTMSPSWVQGKYIGAEGNVGTSSSFYATEYMPVRPNSYVTFYSAIASTAGVAFYDKNQYFVSFYTDDELYKQRTLKVPENAYYIRYSCRADYHDSASRQEQIATVYLTEQIMAVWESMPDMAGYPVDMAKKADAVISWDAVAATAINGITSMANTVLTGNGYGASCNVNEGELYRISGRQFSSAPTNSSVSVYPAYLFINNGNVVHVGWIAEAGYFTNLEILIPSGVTQLIVNLNSSAGLTNAIKKANIINLGNINSQLIQTVQNTAHLDSVMNDMIFPVMTSTSWNTDRIVKLPLNIQSGQTVNFLISDYQATGNKNVSIAFGFDANNGGPYYQQENNKYAGLHRITATQDYDCAYVWIADATVTAICASVWIDGTVSMPRTFSILGDSYSTFSGYNPDGNITWYPSEAVKSNNNCTTVENTWWFQFARDAKCALQLNESYSGAPICNDGYGTGGSDASTTSFIARMNKLPQSEMILVLGGLNDQWAEAQLGEYVYSDWTDAQKSQFRPALAYLFDWLLRYHVGAKIVFVKTDILNSDFSTSIDTVCAHYGIPVVSLTSAVDKTANHPNIAGMREITAQVIYTLVH